MRQECRVTGLPVAADQGCSRSQDVGCGQGRDSLFIARLGHKVTSVDLSPTGIRDLMFDAKAEGLNVTGVVADIREFRWYGEYDVIVVDRTLHMLKSIERINVLRQLLGITKNGSHILISDEKSNIPALRVPFEESEFNWEPTLSKNGYLFMVRQ